jgi:hypothetical protein
MSHWNYRIMKHEYVHEDNFTEVTFELVECYYDDNGIPTGWSETNPSAEGVDDLRHVLVMMESAFAKPVLTKADFHPSREAAMAFPHQP